MRKQSAKLRIAPRWSAWKIKAIISACSTILLCLTIGAASRQAGDTPLPGGRPEDANTAINNPDQYAWELFLALNQQGDPNNPGLPDPTKKSFRDYDQDKDVVWETWALASGGRSGGPIINPEDLPAGKNHPNYSEVFLDDGREPVPWGTWMDRTRAFETEPAQEVEEQRELSGNANIESNVIVPSNGIESPFALPPGSSNINADEVRLNEATYNFIRDNNLYSVEGLEDEFRRETTGGSPPLSFPAGAQEVKAQWRIISEAEKPRYHWRTFKLNGKPVIIGLVALHIITKDLPTWFWCDFVQVDYDKYSEAARQDSTEPKVPENASDDEKLIGNPHPGTEGTKWAYYRLRGTQVAFTDSTGRFGLVANPLIESRFQQTSSCITCHARATVGLRTPACSQQFNHLPVFPTSEVDRPNDIAYGSVGTPNPKWFTDDNGNPPYVQTDFLWDLPFRTLSNKK